MSVQVPVFKSVCSNHVPSNFIVYILIRLYVTLEHKSSLKLLGYIWSNSQKYIIWVKIIKYVTSKIIKILSQDHVHVDILLISYHKYIKT